MDLLLVLRISELHGKFVGSILLLLRRESPLKRWHLLLDGLQPRRSLSSSVHTLPVLCQLFRESCVVRLQTGRDLAMLLLLSTQLLLEGDNGGVIFLHLLRQGLVRLPELLSLLRELSVERFHLLVVLSNKSLSLCLVDLHWKRVLNHRSVRV